MRAALIASLVVLCAMFAGIGIRGALADSKPPHYDPTAYCEDFGKVTRATSVYAWMGNRRPTTL